MKDIDVLALTYNDWCNTLYRYCKCLEYKNFNVVAYKAVPHDFAYPKQIPVHPALDRRQPIDWYPIVVVSPELKYLIERANIIWFHAASYIETGADITNKKVVVSYSGGTYRRGTELCNSFFNPIIKASIIQYPAMLGWGAKNAQLIYYAVDTDFIQPDYNQKDKKITIGHFPSDPRNKGTERIFGVIAELLKEYKDKFQFVATKKNVDWLTQLKFMCQCDVVIESIQYFISREDTDQPHGEWANTALEAAASGCIVISNTHHRDIYEKEYGDLEIVVANDEKQLKEKLIEVIEMSYSDRLEKKMATRKWAEKYHSIPATAERLYEKVFKYLV